MDNKIKGDFDTFIETVAKDFGEYRDKMNLMADAYDLLGAHWHNTAGLWLIAHYLWLDARDLWVRAIQ